MPWKGAYSMVEMLYQYGSNRRCFGILGDRAVRLCDIRKSNDYDELLIMYPQILDEILAQYQKAPFPFKFEGLSGIPAMYRLVSMTQSLIDDELDTGSFSNLVTCFSEAPDILSQWRGYADDGKGCCLGFSMSALQKYCECSNGVLRLEKVNYVTQAEVDTLVAKFSNGILESLRDLREWIVAEMTHSDEDKETDGLLGYNFHGTIKKLLVHSLIFKGAGFAEEKEWRLFLGSQAYKEPQWVHGGNRDIQGPQDFSETLAFLRNRIEFNITEDNISPYISIRFNDFDSIPIKEIWLGPKSKISVSDLKLYLAIKGYNNVKVALSNISYR